MHPWEANRQLIHKDSFTEYFIWFFSICSEGPEHILVPMEQYWEGTAKSPPKTISGCKLTWFFKFWGLFPIMTRAPPPFWSKVGVDLVFGPFFSLLIQRYADLLRVQEEEKKSYHDSQPLLLFLFLSAWPCFTGMLNPRNCWMISVESFCLWMGLIACKVTSSMNGSQYNCPVFFYQWIR